MPYLLPSLCNSLHLAWPLWPLIGLLMMTNVAIVLPKQISHGLTSSIDTHILQIYYQPPQKKIQKWPIKETINSRWHVFSRICKAIVSKSYPWSLTTVITLILNQQFILTFDWYTFMNYMATIMQDPIKWTVLFLGLLNGKALAWEKKVSTWLKMFVTARNPFPSDTTSVMIWTLSFLSDLLIPYPHSSYLNLYLMAVFIWPLRLYTYWFLGSLS